MTHPTPQQQYQQQLEKHNSQLTLLLKKKSTFGWLRLLTFIIATAIAYKLFTAYGLVGFIPVVVGIGVLLYLVSLDVANTINIRNTQLLIQLNEEELEILAHRYTNREDGSRFAPAEHSYAADLDIFGKASLFQWLNRCYTQQGQQLLAVNLLQPLDTATITLRHEAVKEISGHLEWRQQWQAFSMQTTITDTTEKRISLWAVEEEKHFLHPAWKLVTIIYSVLTLASAIAAILGFIPGSIFSGLYLFYLIASSFLSRNTIAAYNTLNGIVKETTTLQNLISWFEGKSFSSVHLQNIQARIKTTTATAGSEIKALTTILDRFDLRVSIMGVLFFNAFLLWDVRQMIALNRWRRRNKSVLASWFTAVAEMEVLHSLGTLQLNRPRWCYPQFTPTHFALHGKEIGHPLLPDEQRVNNDFDLEGTPHIGLITGSNMAGKSTFLRSLGVNMVLAQMGAPVCAASFLLSPVSLVSSMRIADNLAENTSTFYAELKKLRTIIELVKAHKHVFILLDEILRGTNSFDRHKGSAALIKQLIKEDAVAVIATHDVELAALQKAYPTAIDNYHFDVKVEGEELYFDYKLKDGVCQSLNASILMKKIGIDLE